MLKKVGLLAQTIWKLSNVLDFLERFCNDKLSVEDPICKQSLIEPDFRKKMNVLQGSINQIR